MRQKNRANSAPPSQVSHQTTEKALRERTDALAFHALCERVLERHYHFRVFSLGRSADGHVPGQPDARGYDQGGKRCAFQFSLEKGWKEEKGKLSQDLAAVAEIDDEPYEVFVFCTNQHVGADIERELRHKVKEKYGWELILFGAETLAIALDTDCQFLRWRYLGIRFEELTWNDLLEVCAEQRQSMQDYYKDLCPPKLYVPRQAEQLVASWYQHAVQTLRQREPEGAPTEHQQLAQFLSLADGMGTGKSTLVWHLAEQYGKFGPVLLFRGNLPLNNVHSLEEEIISAVGYPVGQRTYHADVATLCQIALEQGQPFLIIFDALNLNNSPQLMQDALTQLIIRHRKLPLLVLVTCRDTMWSHFKSPIWDNYVPPKVKQRPHSDADQDMRLKLGTYSEEEFQIALKHYFDHWGIQVVLGQKAAHVLHSPLLLRIFAEVNHDRKSGRIDTITANELWGKYRTLKVEEITKEVHLRKEAIHEALETIARRIFEQDHSDISISDLRDIRNIDPDSTAPQSLLMQLKDVGILFEVDQPPRIRFVYDTFLEFILGTWLARAFEQSEDPSSVLARLESSAKTPRWRQIPLYVAELVSEPALVVNWFRSRNLWRAVQVFWQVRERVPSLRAEFIGDLVQALESPRTLDRSRAAKLLGLLGATEAKEALLHHWSHEQLPNALEALARLGVEKVIPPFVLYLGRNLDWYLPEDQELVDGLPESFRQQLFTYALKHLEDQDQGFAAAHALGYLQYPKAIESLLTCFRASGCTNWAAPVALLRIETPAAFEALNRVLDVVGERLDAFTQARKAATIAGIKQAPQTDIEQKTVGTLEHLRVQGFLYSPREPTIAFLTRLLKHANLSIRHMAAQSLGQLGAAETAFDIVQSASLLGWNMGIMEALRAFGTQIPVEPLLALVQDSEAPESVLVDAVQALGLSRDPRVLDPLQALLKEERFLLACILALGESGLPAAAPILAPLLEVADLRGKSRPAVDKDMVVRTLGRLCTPLAFTPLEQYARHCWPKVSEATIEALVASDSERALPLVQELPTGCATST